MSWYLAYGQTIRYDRSFDTKEEAMAFIHANPGYRADGLYNLQYGVSVKEGELDDGTSADDVDDAVDS